MDNQNWSSYYFTKDGSLPSYPPPRIRLSSGFTKYTSSCSLEDLHDAGYEGPIEVIPVGANQKRVWDFASNKFILVSAEGKDPTLVNREVRSYCSEQISCLDLDDKSSYDDNFRNAWSRYITILVNLLKKPESELLTFEDLPEIPTTVENQADHDAKLAQDFINDNFERWKGQYEKYGFCFEVPLDVQPYFSIPSDWVAGSQPLPSGTSNYFQHAVPPQPLP